MNPKTLDFNKRAIEELREAYSWYKSQSPTAAHDFKVEFRRTMEKLRAFPSMGSNYLFGTRRFVMNRFPYLIVYLETLHGIKVIAVAHGSRRQGYWHGRMG